MIDLSTKLVNDYEPRASKKMPEKDFDQMNKLDQIRNVIAEELFIDPVFGNNSNLKRDEWEKQVLLGAPWIFDSGKVRSIIYARSEKE